MPGLAEIQLALMPQNINLAHVIADNKGCYLGQEVVAKAITYQKHVKILKALKLSEEKFAHAHAREKIIDDEGQEAFITSLAPIYVNNWPNILALVNT
jgi:folate-binding protein YgfZ